MWTQTWKSIRNTLALSNWTMSVAAVAGLALGSVHLNESLDLATAVGIACFLSVAIGLWLAIHLYRLLIYGIYFAVAMVSFVIVDVSLGAQCLYIWYLQRKVAAIERPVERTVAVPQVAGGTAVLDASISRARQFSLRFVGVKPSSPERTTV